MSIRTIACSSSKRNSASALASSVLPTPVGPMKRNEPRGLFGSCRPARARLIVLDTASMASSWPDDALMEALLHLDHLLPLAFEHPRDGYARPLGDDLGDILFVHLFLEHLLVRLELGKPLLLLRQLLLETRRSGRTGSPPPCRGRPSSPPRPPRCAAFSIFSLTSLIFVMSSPSPSPSGAFFSSTSFFRPSASCFQLLRASPRRPRPSPS